MDLPAVLHPAGNQVNGLSANKEFDWVLFSARLAWANQGVRLDVNR